MKPEMVSTPTRLVAMCLGPEAGGAFDIREVPRRKPGPDEVEIAVEAASVNPIDVRRAAGYGRRPLPLMGASRFRPMRPLRPRSAMTAKRVRGAKAALSSGCKPHPATAPTGSNRAVMEVTKWLERSV